MVSKFSHFSFETCYCNLFRIQPDRCFITFFLVVVVAKKKELHLVHSFSFSFSFSFFVILIFLESAYFSVEMQRTSIVAQKDFWAKSCQWQLHHFSTARTGTTTTKQNSNLWNKSQNLLLISYISLPRVPVLAVIHHSFSLGILWKMFGFYAWQRIPPHFSFFLLQRKILYSEKAFIAIAQQNPH